jgi:hypothetical protein
MNNEEILVHKCQVEIAGTRYEVHVFLLEDGRHVAKTVLDRDDILINDGPSLEEVLDKHQSLLPLAIDSRAILQSYRSSRKQ